MKSRIAIACIVAGSMIAPGAAYAWGTNKSAQSNEATTAQAPSSSTSVKEAVSDATITTKIKAEMAKERGVSASHIKVDTDNGVVKLSGTARSRDEADRAAAIAKETKGVVSVRNDIQIAAASK
jgi:hyperosmotically inducible protein